MIYLFAGHPRRAVITRSFPLLKNVERGPDADNVGGPSAKHVQTGIHFAVVPQDKVQNNIERRLNDTCQRRAQVFAMNLYA